MSVGVWEGVQTGRETSWGGGGHMVPGRCSGNVCGNHKGRRGVNRVHCPGVHGGQALDSGTPGTAATLPLRARWGPHLCDMILKASGR